MVYNKEDEQEYDYLVNLKKNVKEIINIILSFHVLLTNLLNPKKKGDTKAQLSILKGPLLSPTRRKLLDLQRKFDELGYHLRYQDMIPTRMSRRSFDYWEKYEKNATVLKNVLLANLTPNSDGKFFNNIKAGKLKREDVIELRKDVAALLAILRPLAEGKEHTFFHSYEEEQAMRSNERLIRANDAFLNGGR